MNLRARALPLAPALAADVLASAGRAAEAALRREPRPAPLRPADVRARPGLPQVGPGSASLVSSRLPAGAAEAALHAFLRAFYVPGPWASAYWRADAGSCRPASFWRTAELIELLEDAYERRPSADRAAMIAALCRGALLRFGAVWTRRRAFNDDVLWMVLAFIRACGITGEVRYLTHARENFDLTLARGWSPELGGGLWWTTTRREKNACVAGPAAIAACLLAVALDEPGYGELAAQVYAWLRRRLFAEDSGRVADRIELRDGETRLVRDAATYNQGTLIGAADLLARRTGTPRYREDARRALAFTRRELTRDGLLHSEGPGGDGGGFKGIFARYAVRFVRAYGLTDDERWLWRNASAAWARGGPCGLIPEDWASAPAASPPACAHPPSAWDASSAVVLLQVLQAGRPAAGAPPPIRPTSAH